MTKDGTVPLTVERAEQLIRLLTDGLVNIVDETGEFLLPRESCFVGSCCASEEPIADK